jgi:hypothetical protein
VGNGAATAPARRPDERGCTGGGSSGSMEKFTPHNSEELITKPPATRGLRKRSFRPWPYLPHSSLTEMMGTEANGTGCPSPQKTSHTCRLLRSDERACSEGVRRHCAEKPSKKQHAAQTYRVHGTVHSK